MTQRHFIEIAQAIDLQRQLCETDQERFRVGEVALDLAIIAKRDNRRFNAGRFLTACGYPQLVGTRMGLN